MMKSQDCYAMTQVRVAAAGALAAVTMLWAGTMNAALFHAGTVMLVVCLIPLSRGLGVRGGVLLGLLLSLVWLAAGLGFRPRVDLPSLMTGLNVAMLLAMVLIGGLAGGMLRPVVEAVELPSSQPSGPRCVPAARTAETVERARATDLSLQNTNQTTDAWCRALARHRDWMSGWDRATSPWTSFDQHIREVVRMLTGMKRLRCYRVGAEGRLYPLNQEASAEPVEPVSRDLLNHVVLTGRRYAAHLPTVGPLVQQLAETGQSAIAWALPIRDGNVTIGLVTAEVMLDPPLGEDFLEAVGDFVEQTWLHVQHLDELRSARQTDRASGLINRTDFLPAVRTTLEQSYRLHEPVVVMVVCLEGLRSLDDASQWGKRDELIVQVGQAIAGGLRKDDLVGRFSDSQFVAVLRRLDIPLAELICRKLLGNLSALVEGFDLGSPVAARAGLSGSGFADPSAETLLKHAMSALNRARTEGIPLLSELPEDPEGDSKG